MRRNALSLVQSRQLTFEHTINAQLNVWHNYLYYRSNCSDFSDLASLPTVFGNISENKILLSWMPFNMFKAMYLSLCNQDTSDSTHRSISWSLPPDSESDQDVHKQHSTWQYRQCKCSFLDSRSTSFHHAQTDHLDSCSLRLEGRCDKSKWAATWQNQQNECAPSEDSDRCPHEESLGP